MRTVGKKIYATSAEIEQIILKTLEGKFDKEFRLYLPDSEYYLAPRNDVDKILEKSSVDLNQWIAEMFDCDDFAICLKADFAKAAYKQGKRRAPYSMGIVWGMLPGPHAINWFVGVDQQVYFIEPQSDEIFEPRPSDRNIWLMLA